MKEIMTVDDVAALLAVHPQTIRKWLRKGEITAADTPAGYRFQPSDVETWLAKYRTPPAAQAAAAEGDGQAVDWD